MARRDNNKDLFHSLYNTGCKNTPVIPAFRILVKIKLETPFRKLRVCPLTVCTSELIFCTGSSGNLFYFTLPENADTKLYNFIKQLSKTQSCVTAWECLYFLETGQIYFLFCFISKVIPRKASLPQT